MANWFSANRAQLGEKDLLIGKYNAARMNILIMVIATLINVILAIAGEGTYFLFSATIPYILTDLSMFLCGFYPPEYYVGGLEGLEILPVEFFITGLSIAILIIALYAIAYFFSSKGRVGWIIFALVFFVLDTLALFGYYGFNFQMIVDYVFHIWIIVILSLGIKAHYNLKAIPEEPEGEQLIEERVYNF